MRFWVTCCYLELKEFATTIRCKLAKEGFTLTLLVKQGWHVLIHTLTNLCHDHVETYLLEPQAT
jgi:hypothetical protein